MNKNTKDIDQYIKECPQHIQPKLNELKEIIRAIVPSDCIETMSYKMPTFKWKNNIIHFALNKNHIGIYPGPTAITAYKQELIQYNTSKGTIQIGLDKDIPKAIIEKLIQFNIKMIEDKSKKRQISKVEP